MIRYVARRVGLITITLLVVSLAIFTITEVLPGDVAQMMLKETATPEGLARIRNELNLDRPAHVRYLDWIGGVVQDAGTDDVVKRVAFENRSEQVHLYESSAKSMCIMEPASHGKRVPAHIRAHYGSPRSHRKIVTELSSPAPDLEN